ncbi:TetR/AcrR family transcriptional regulator [Spirillospora sp. CA-294931]|uniref:TetR/AcrR family transcriptional regulator n=1 Tax=Spirillospora sp. CA-294931 TaxID=3240042 RepID=UPI003D8A923D
MTEAENVNIWLLPDRPARGPKPAYSRAQITETAVRLADAEGIEAASMRRIAAEIGAGAMSLYRYVPSRDDLIELMIDHTVGEIEYPERPTGDWRHDLALLGHGWRAMWRRHSWLLFIRRGGPSFGPNQIRIMEFTFSVLDVGIPIDEILSLSGLLTGYVESAVRGEVGWREQLESTGMSMQEWTAKSHPLVRQFLESGDYPMLERVVRDARQPHMDFDARFRYGLDRTLDWIAGALPPDRFNG